MKKFVLFAFIVFSNFAFAGDNPAKQIKKKMCFLSFPVVTYTGEGSRSWSMDDYIDHPEVYKFYTLITSEKTKVGDNVVLDFTGFVEQNNTSLPVSGNALYDPENGWTFNLESAEKLGYRNTRDLTQLETTLAIWDAYSNIDDQFTGNEYIKQESVSPNAEPVKVFQTDIVRKIYCK